MRDIFLGVDTNNRTTSSLSFRRNRTVDSYVPISRHCSTGTLDDFPPPPPNLNRHRSTGVIPQHVAGVPPPPPFGRNSSAGKCVSLRRCLLELQSELRTQSSKFSDHEKPNNGHQSLPPGQDICDDDASDGALDPPLLPDGHAYAACCMSQDHLRRLDAELAAFVKETTDDEDHKIIPWNTDSDDGHNHTMQPQLTHKTTIAGDSFPLATDSSPWHLAELDHLVGETNLNDNDSYSPKRRRSTRQRRGSTGKRNAKTVRDGRYDEDDATDHDDASLYSYSSKSITSLGHDDKSTCSTGHEYRRNSFTGKKKRDKKKVDGTASGVNDQRRPQSLKDLCRSSKSSQLLKADSSIIKTTGDKSERFHSSHMSKPTHKVEKVNGKTQRNGIGPVNISPPGPRRIRSCHPSIPSPNKESGGKPPISSRTTIRGKIFQLSRLYSKNPVFSTKHGKQPTSTPKYSYNPNENAKKHRPDSKRDNHWMERCK